jgi:two-component system sensor histidine kinase UhpB
MKKPLCILIVEDNPGDLLLLKEHLHLTGIGIQKLLEAESLQKAKEILAEEKPDLVLLDLFLPDSNGLETFTQLNHLTPAIPIAVLSGLSDSQTALKTIQAGAQDYIVKGDYDERLLSKIIHYSIERNSITQRLKQSFERYDLMAKATSDIVWDWDVRTNANWFSENFVTLFGYKDEELEAGLDAWYERIHPEDKKRVVDGIKKAIEDGHRHWQDEYRFLKADSSYAYIFDRGYALYDNEDKPYRMIGAMQDITKLKLLQEKIVKDELEHQREITEATIYSQEKEREEIGNELHDNINQILATCKLMIELSLKNEALRDEVLPKSLSNLNLAIEEIRKLSKSLVPPTLEGRGLRDAVQDLIETAGAYSNLRFTLVADEYPADALPDKQLQLTLYRIVQEQVNNIVKHAKATAVSIALSLKNGQIALTISDNGIGFNTNEKKNGIGLRNICSRVQMHGGKVQLKSTPGAGCRLHVGIPYEGNF